MKIQEKAKHQLIHLWTVEDYHRMIEHGLLPTDERVELLAGIVFHMSPKGIHHVIISRWISDQFKERLEAGTYVLTQDPITLVEQGSEPEPDITLAQGSMFDYLDHHPYPEDIL